MSLTAWELADIRSDLAASLTETARILRRTVNRTDVRGIRETWTPDGSTVPASLASSGLAEHERVIAGKMTELTTYVLTFPAGTAIVVRDRVALETDDGVPSARRVFDVVSAGDTTHEFRRRVLATEIIPTPEPG